MKGIQTNDYQYVDLGLPSGTLWAACNVGAQKPTESGLFFQWGDTKGYEKPTDEKPFNRQTYKYYGIINGRFGYTKYTRKDGKKTLDLDDDAAHVHMGGSWKMPTIKQLEELSKNVKFRKCNKHVILESLCNGKQMILPLSGYFINQYNSAVDLMSLLWGCETSIGECVSYFCTSYEIGASQGTYRFFGFNVRGVINK